MLAAGKHRLLPRGFRAVEYIQSTGTQYIDTGYIPNSNTASSVKVVYVLGNNSVFYYGSAIGYNNNAYECYPWSDNITFGYGKSYLYSNDVANKDGQIVTISRKQEAVELVWEDGTIMTPRNLVNAFECPYPLALFVLHRPTGIIYPTVGNRCYFARFLDGDVLARDFLPCVRESDGKPGMYDLCGSICPLTNSQFYINAGTGEFTVGPDVN